MSEVNPFIQTITSEDSTIRNRSLHGLCAQASPRQLLAWCEELEVFRRGAGNLYERVRATLFLYAIYRFYLVESPEVPEAGTIPYEGFNNLLDRRFEEAIARFRTTLAHDGANGALLSALAKSYHLLSFQTLSDQVRRSVRASAGNQWMFRVGHAEDHPVRMRPELLQRLDGSQLYPILCERTPVRLDLSHSGWSDIFFLGMDYPEGARVLNISVDLGVYGRDDTVRPPIETYVRVIPEPVIRLTSIDLETTKDITNLNEMFNFGNDYLGLLKAGVIASGVVPQSFEGTNQPVDLILRNLVGQSMGLELVTQVNDIPKGSRLAVSTNLLGSIVSVLMRASGQTRSLEGSLTESERRLAASRAILGEWLGGSGGGWQDSGGIWPGFKLIQGALAEEEHPEWGVSRGCLLPDHELLADGALHPETPARLKESLVLVNGGMAQNVGPTLEMVTEKYLLRSESEWAARGETRGIFDTMVACLKTGDIRGLAESTTRNWNDPLKTIIPWVTNRFTESILESAQTEFGDDFWGFLMLGGMSGGGMGMFSSPERHEEFRKGLLKIMIARKRELEDALPFAMDPVVYDFDVNQEGSTATLYQGDAAVMPDRYFTVQIPNLVQMAPDSIPYLRRAELDNFTAQTKGSAETFTLLRSLVSNLFRVSDSTIKSEQSDWDADADRIKEENGFDLIQHEQTRADLLAGRIGLSHNRLPVDTDIRDVCDEDVVEVQDDDSRRELGVQALQEGRVAVLTLAGGLGSRWTTGAGVVKSINPFVEMGGKHRSFLEIHLAKTRHAAQLYKAEIPHIVSTSFLTHGSIEKHLGLNSRYGYDGPLFLSPGRSIGQRLVPLVRDLVFLWQELPQETLDEQKQKVREAVRSAMLDWAREKGEGSDYTDNAAIQRINPPGHWYEVANLLQNGTLAALLRDHPQVETLMLHNVDTLAADLAPAPLGIHLDSGNMLTFEVVPRCVDDRGGGLARVNGQVRLLEGLAQPREEDEFALRYYNSMTTWIQIDALLESFGLDREALNGSQQDIAEAIRRMAGRVTTYVTIKDVKRRWGHGQEDVYPVAQFEKLWSDITALPDISCGYAVVPRMRGQQLKDPDQIDAWANDGSKDYVAALARFA
jgi:galactokinase/mevalonate kinase-like predicted kinase